MQKREPMTTAQAFRTLERLNRRGIRTWSDCMRAIEAMGTLIPRQVISDALLGKFKRTKP